MKNSIYLVVLFFLFACNSSEIIDEPIGKSEFYIQNNSSKNIKVAISYLYDPPQEELINSNDQLFLGEFYGDFGIHAFPEIYIEQLLIIEIGVEADTLFLNDSINREEWEHETPSGYVWWEYAKYTYVVDDALFE